MKGQKMRQYWQPQSFLFEKTASYLEKIKIEDCQ